MTQAALAAAAGCDERSVREAEAGRGSMRAFLSMAAALGRDVAGRSLPPGKDVGARLLALRYRTGKSRRGLATATGLSATTLAAMERGHACRLGSVERYADALGAGLVLVPAGEGVGFFAGVALSSAWDAWATPQWVLDRLYEAIGGGFDVDPCSPGRGRSRVRATTHFDEAEDGLAQAWFGKVFLNPPYGRSFAKWVAKARAEVAARRATFAIGLVPARTDTAWWHANIAGHAHVWLLKGRLGFGDGSTPAPFASALAAWGTTAEQRSALSAAFPNAWYVGT